MAACLLAGQRLNVTDSSPVFPPWEMQSCDFCPLTTWDAPLWCQAAVVDYDHADTDLTLI